MTDSFRPRHSLDDAEAFAAGSTPDPRRSNSGAGAAAGNPYDANPYRSAGADGGSYEESAPWSAADTRSQSYGDAGYRGAEYASGRYEGAETTRGSRVDDVRPAQSAVDYGDQQYRAQGAGAAAYGAGEAAVASADRTPGLPGDDELLLEDDAPRTRGFRRGLGRAAAVGGTVAAASGAATAAGARRGGRAAAGLSGDATGPRPGSGEGEDTDGERKAGSGLPLRGLAMILLAVGVLLVAWGLYTFLGNDDASEDTAAPATSQSQEAQPTPQQNQPAPSSPAASGAPSQSPSAPAPAPSSAPASSAAPAPATDGAGAAPVNREQTPVTVLNNSAVQGLAGDTASRLRGQQWSQTGYGNLPGSQYTFPRSVVLYPRGDANARAAAEAVGRDLGLPAQERTEDMDRSLAGAQMLQGPAPAAVVVVTTGDMPR